MSKREVYAKLGEARKRKQEGDVPAATAALREAIDLADAAGESKLLGTASWRLADMLRDADQPEAMLESLDALVASGAPFANLQGAKAWEAANATARKFWDFVGYDTERLIPLFDALREHYASNDPYMAAQADELSAWQFACRGDRDGMQALLDRYRDMTPSQFGTGRHRHTRADSTGSSVYWVTMEIARSALRMGAWMHDEAIARDAWDVHRVAARKAGQRATEFPHFLEASMIAALQFGWDEVIEASTEDYDTAIRGWDGGRTDYHQAVHKAVHLVLAGQHGEASDAWRDVATIADEMHYGPEWVGDFLLRAADSADTAGRADDAKRWRIQAAEVIDEYGFEAMRGRLA
ncbi:MAG: hypothetical protein EP330_20260 [Deltaproteobacteria bacterium]|nr:MAG: hypothetical protein EP330_20260 [Deltaproteobacteria bacterium]